MFNTMIRTYTALALGLLISVSVRAQDLGASFPAPEGLFTVPDSATSVAVPVPEVLFTVPDPAASVAVSDLASSVAVPDPDPLFKVPDFSTSITAQYFGGSQLTSVQPREREFDALQQRVKELELMFQAQEDATRQIIRQSFFQRGTQINDFVTFGGTFETLATSFDDFDGTSTSEIALATAQFDFEITVNHWTRASLIYEYLDGTNILFPTTQDAVAGTAIDRVNVDTAFLVIGDLQQCPLFMTVGRNILPFGISTGDPVADVLNIESPLTLEVFEMKQDEILLGFDILDPRPPTETVMMTPRPAQPLLFAPIFRGIGARANRHLCYPDMWSPPRQQVQVPIPVCTLYRYNGGILFFSGNTRAITANAQTGLNKFIKRMGATAGYQAKGYGWSFDVDVDFTSSVFESRFLEFEYFSYLDQINFVSGMAAHVKATRGPVSLIAEWNGALHDAKFVDDLGNDISIAPSAWQVALAYQFDWNPTITDIGSQGTYVTLCYSQSQDLAGVTKVNRRIEPGAASGDPAVTTFDETRVGFVPRDRLLVGLGEWLTDGLRVSFEYAHVIDYSVAKGGTGKAGNSWVGMLTYTW